MGRPSNVPQQRSGIAALHTRFTARTLKVTDHLETTLAVIAERNAGMAIYLALDESDARIAARSSDARYASGRPLSVLDGVLLAVKDNIAGAPAVSVPMPCAADEHSAGLQIIAKPGADMAALALCAAYEAELAP